MNANKNYNNSYRPKNYKNKRNKNNSNNVDDRDHMRTERNFNQNRHFKGNRYYFSKLSQTLSKEPDDCYPSSRGKRRKQHNDYVGTVSSSVVKTNNNDNNKRSKRKNKNKIPLEKKSLPRFKGTGKLDTNVNKKINHVKNNKLLPLLQESNLTDNINSSDIVPSSISLFSKDPTELLKWLLHPVKPDNFYEMYWEKNPLLICRYNTDYYSPLNVTTETVDELLKDNHVLFGKNIDITTYTDGVRETHNPVGRAHAHIVWDFFKNGCSVRLLNPQTYIHSVYRMNEILQNAFKGFVGANVYLTPPNSQGFAPHYDDIEAFVLQLEGTKYWKVYRPRSDNEVLPRYSSPNFTEEEVGEPILEVALNPGDLLYFPRGFIHQASTRDQLSLHITLSAYQCNSYFDLFEKLLPAALKSAAANDVEFRKGLPLNVADDFGIAKESKATDNIKEIKEKVETLVKRVFKYINIDTAVDSLVARNLHDQLPPHFTEEEKNSMVFNNRTKLSKDGKTIEVVQLQLASKVRLINPNLCRLVKTDDKYLMYHSINNSMEYHGNEEEFLEVPEESVPAFKKLCQVYPNYVRVKSLPIADDEAKWSFANSLWEVGLLRTQDPLESIKTDFSGSVEENGEEDSECSNDDVDDKEVMNCDEDSREKNIASDVVHSNNNQSPNSNINKENTYIGTSHTGSNKKLSDRNRGSDVIIVD